MYNTATVDNVTKHHYAPPPAVVQNPTPDTRTQLFSLYKSFLSTLINMSSPQLMMSTVTNNNLYNSGNSGIHEQYIHYGRRVADLSMGQLQHPWAAADADRKNEVTLEVFDRRAAGSTDLVVAQRLWAISQFIRTVQAQYAVLPRIFFYKNDDASVVSVTLMDEVNDIKFGYMPTASV
jgi:hypothetical protein